ncbi:MAG: imidazole glycerol phosphate synthase cyclase subunit, partial [Gammaproteobacteria bacterium]|nr:imidazole glycerol phosphate synthase cyclase subunit [Gammaproteobacteria bacterium]
LIDIPFCVAGGIRSTADAEAVLAAGADKISVNSPALERPELINELAERFGSQCVVVGIDSIRVNGDDEYRVKKYTGISAKTRDAERTTLAWVNEVQQRGAGEIVLNCMNSDGVKEGYDLAQLLVVRENCDIPLVASGGAGEMQHFLSVFEDANVDGALAASIFHAGDVLIPDLKNFLRNSGVTMRL